MYSMVLAGTRNLTTGPSPATPDAGVRGVQYTPFHRHTHAVRPWIEAHRTTTRSAVNMPCNGKKHITPNVRRRPAHGSNFTAELLSERMRAGQPRGRA